MKENIFVTLIRKIELQSIIVLTITLLVGLHLLNKSQTLISIQSIIGSIIMGFGILYTFVSFFTNNIRESYKDVILEYKSTISTLRESTEYISKTYQDAIDTTAKDYSDSGYKPLEQDGTSQ